MKTRTLALLISGFTTMILFQNCSKQALQIDDLGPVNSSSVDKLPTGVQSLIDSCNSAKERGQIQTKTLAINFEDNVGECPWDSADNVSMKNGSITARIEQLRQVQVPAGATVCQVKMENMEEQNFRYDDNIILALNGYILASTTTFSQHFQSSNGYYQYNWSRLLNKAAQNSGSSSTLANQYCAGKSQGLSSCKFPKTETLGRVSLQFDERVIQNILGMTSASVIELNMITTGDDNPDTDCHHVPVRLNVQIEYF